MFGPPWIRLVKPLTKNFWLITMMIVVSRSSTSPMAMWFSERTAGRGQFHIMCPMEMYISGIQKHREAISLRFIFGVSLSFRDSSSAAIETPFPRA